MKPAVVPPMRAGKHHTKAAVSCERNDMPVSASVSDVSSVGDERIVEDVRNVSDVSTVKDVTGTVRNDNGASNVSSWVTASRTHEAAVRQ